MLKKMLIALLIMLPMSDALAGKIVIFDPQEAIMRTQFAQKKMQAFEGSPEYVKVKSAFEGASAELALLDKEQKQKSMTWSDEEKAQHRSKMQQANNNRTQSGQILQNESKALIQDIFQEYQPKLEEILKKYVEDNKIDMMLQRQAVAYSIDPKIDVTLEIATELDKLE